ncbi:MAG: non-homologous end-joining DNA ligase [Tepidiformaceae bacterium]
MPGKPRPGGDYRAKRDFTVTPEPPPAEAGPGEGALVFMLHKHSATRLHYDLRLELDGVLVSWAVPKGPSSNVRDKHLAMHVEDHPLAYGGFEGLIPKGQYGGGPSLIWDAGTFSPDEGGRLYWDDRDGAQRELREGLAAGKLSITFRGRKLKGSWTLVRTRRAPNEWLLIKHKDAFADTGRDLLDDGESVLSGRTIDELRDGVPPHNRLPELPYAAPATLTGSKPAPLQMLAPMLATSAAIPTTAIQPWSFEPKLDGIRLVAGIDHGRVELRSRGGHDIGAQYPGIVAGLATQPVAAALFDGEIVAVGADGRASFELLQQRMNLQDAGQIAEAERNIPVVYFVFDVLHLDGYDLTGAALKDRREVLVRVLNPTSRIVQVATIEVDAEAAFEVSIGAGFEGIIAKREDSRYEPGRRSSTWLKRKAQERAEFVVAGFTAGNGSRSDSFGGLILAELDAGRLAYRGRVGGGLTGAEASALRNKLDRLVVKASPFAARTPDDKTATWVRPELRVLVEYHEKTAGGVLRQPVFKGIVGEQRPPSRGAVPVKKLTPPAVTTDALAQQLKCAGEKTTLEGEGWSLPVTNLGKALWPASERGRAITKRDLLRYALTVAPLAIPHLRDRPLTLQRFPNGTEGKRFYQRHWETIPPPFVETVTAFAEGEGADREWLLCNNLPTLLWLCQVADIEWHASLARISPEPDARSLPLTFSGSEEAVDASPLNHPDFLLFDLDPYIYAGNEKRGDEPQPNREGFDKTVAVALGLKELLDSLGMASFVKTSGATGLHVYVPIVRNLEYDSVRAAANTIFSELASRRPKDTTMDWATGKRVGRVFLDANQNARHKSLAAPYSARAKPGGPVSLPYAWSDIETAYAGDTTLLDPWWAGRADPWAGILSAKHDLKRLLGLSG